MKIYLKKLVLSQVTLMFAFACSVLLPKVQAVCQQGCDTPNANTFLGDDALVNNATGYENTAVGFNALLSNTDGPYNTAIGWKALQANTTEAIILPSEPKRFF